jgi:Mor family transcriptional regulator
MATRIKAAPGNRRYDWVQIQADRTAGMGIRDLCAKYGCTDVSIYNRTVGPGNPAKRHQDRHKELETVRNAPWTEIQNKRTEGATPTSLAAEYGMSVSSIFKHTKGVGSGNYKHKRRTPQAPKAYVLQVPYANGTASARELARQALVTAVAEREKLDAFIKQLEAINS